MLKYTFAIVAFCLSLNSYAQTKVNSAGNGFTIDTSIRPEVEKHIEDSKDLGTSNDKTLIYNNELSVESYENDTLSYTTYNKKIKRVFKSFYYWNSDTLRIDGAFGLFTGVGFAIDIYKNKAAVYHMLSSDESPAYAYNKNDSLIFRLEVPCTDTKIILSQIPGSTQSQVIYGYVEFKSGNYYASTGTINGREESPRKKLRTNMKIYFKSSELIFPR